MVVVMIKKNIDDIERMQINKSKVECNFLLRSRSFSKSGIRRIEDDPRSARVHERLIGRFKEQSEEL